MIDYKGFWQDFSIADAFGLAAIQDTYNRALEWKTNTEYITSLVITLNHKIWFWYEKNDNYARLYNKLWSELDEWCLDNLKGKDLEYYIQTTDQTQMLFV